MIRYLTLVIIIILQVLQSYAADHSDTPLLIDEGRNDARITDLYAFTKNDNLILILDIDPSVPNDATAYNFSTDVEYRFNIDNNSEVTADGEIVDKRNIHEDIIISIRFQADGKPVINDVNDLFSILAFPLMALFSCASDGNDADIEDAITNFFAGPRDDPFIRGPRIGQNVASIALEIPLNAVVRNNNSLIIWADTKVDNLPGEFQERAGRPLTSMFNDVLNTTHPNEDFDNFGIEPDVLVLNTSMPSGFPNGRVLEDDVVDIVCPGVCDMLLANDAPFPSENDVQFLKNFPYLAPPH